MADEEQLKKLIQGVDEWNQWRRKNPSLKIDLRQADLSKGQFKFINLQEANLEWANLQEANLEYANLQGANLEAVNLQRTILSNVNLIKANLGQANLDGTSLAHTWLVDAIFHETNLKGADFSSAEFGNTDIKRLNLGETKNLDLINHRAPSQINIGTLQLSKGRIPESFLRGCGLSDWEIESAKLYRVGLSSGEINNIVYRIYDLRANQAIQINPLFISYSHKDGVFVDEIEKYLDEKGIRFWRDIHDATAGRLEKVVDRAMRLNPTVLLILSKDSVKSDWVEHEARLARGLEKELKRDVLCPIALDGAWKECEWPERLREQIMEYNILDFSMWQDKGNFRQKFGKLIEGLDLFY